MEIGHQELIQFCQTVADELDERLKRMQVLVDYKLRSGTAYAEILRSFLAARSAGKYDVAEGFIVNPFIRGASSNHCDILIYDQIQYPLLDSEGDVKVISPRAASMVIEVERSLSEKRLVEGVRNIASARKVYPYLTGVIFAFNGLEPEAFYESMCSHADSWSAAYAPVAIINMQKRVIASRSPLRADLGGGGCSLDVYELKAADSAGLLAFLFLLFFNLQMHGMLVPGSLDKAWKYLLSAGKASHLGKVNLPQ